ncbi:hypothetical protein TRAPUB_10779 [Trametes pubescens]|uniref:Uncharacterized protein n=1 Tax=Trametes pubescens TaxID=154538 RepID=A0A1M2VYJ6_TRAPU|nr:hypothetical protein TRAPUB_10779 [Trametes pubescens]
MALITVYQGAAEVELADRVERARERYKRHKSSKYDLEETILETQNKIDETTAEYERELQKRQEELLQLDTLASEAQNTLGATETPQFDLVDFLYNPMSDTDGAELLEEDVLAPSIFANATALPNAIAKLCSPHGFAMRRSGEVVWPSDPPSRAHCLFFSSTHHYDPKAHNSKGGWASVWDMRAHTDKTKEVFYLKAQKWFYAGTYECQKRSILPFSEISVLEKQHKHDLQQRTVLNSDMVAPMLVKMIRDMYDCGALKIVCTGWCRIGFNDKLADALRSLGDTTTVPGRATHRPYPGGARIQVPPEGLRSGKRRHEDEDTAPRKKHKE